MKKKYRLKKPQCIIIPCFILFLLCSCFILAKVIPEEKETVQPKDYTMNDVNNVDYPPCPYDLNQFIWQNGVIVYEDDNYTSLCGIDISEHQGDIDFNKAKADGIEYVYLRLGYRGYQSGDLFIDAKFEEYYKQAKEAGLPIGVYFFSSAITAEEAMDEAYFVLEHIQDKEIDFPIAYDLEDIDYDTYRHEELSNEEKTTSALAFCQIIQDNNYNPIIYASTYWLNEIYDLSKIYNYDVWVAQYGSTLDYNYDFKIWQYTQKGTVDGIDKKVDINVMIVKKRH